MEQHPPPGSMKQSQMGRRKRTSGTGQMGTERVTRGGSWNDNARNVRAANRNGNSPDNRDNNLGFRLAESRSEAERNP